MKKTDLKKLSALLLVITTIFFSGCSVNTVSLKTVTLDDVIKNVNTKNAQKLKSVSTYDEADFLIDVNSESFTDEELKAMSSSGYENVTKAEAKEDVETLFRFLKSSYAGYTYFGGDEAFGKAEKEIKSNIDSFSKNKLNQEELAGVIMQSLGFVKDSHFIMLGKQAFEEAHTYYESEKREFKMTEDNRYCTEIDDAFWYLPAETEKYMKLTIGESGELVYGMFAVVTDEEKEGLPTSVQLENGDKKQEIKLDWIISEVGGDQSAQAKFSEENGVAISSLADMTASESSIGEINNFLNDSKKLAGYDNSILDLRENDGGLAEIDMFWIYGYTGKIADISNTVYTFKDDKFERIEKLNGVLRPTEPLDTFDIVKENSELMDVYTNLENEFDDFQGVRKANGVLNCKPDKIISNPNTLFVLQSKHNYSAGEAFLMMLDNVENVVSVGTNTNGCVHFGNVFPLALPNSKTTFTFSISILTGFDKDFDVYGLEPDIYIADDDAQEAVLKCIEYYSKDKS